MLEKPCRTRNRRRRNVVVVFWGRGERLASRRRKINTDNGRVTHAHTHTEHTHTEHTKHTQSAHTHRAHTHRAHTLTRARAQQS